MSTSAHSPFSGGAYRDRFELPRDAHATPLTYLCGHSLGPMPTDARAQLHKGIEAWSSRAVDGHFEGELPWFTLGEALRTPMGAIVGAEAQDVALHGTLTTNLHLLLRSFYAPSGARTKLLIERGAFPSDRFCARSHVHSRGLDPDTHVVEVRGDGPLGVPTTEELIAAIEAEGEQLATVLLPGVSYGTGAVYDLRAITEAGHRVGATVGWDLAHAVGNIELALDADGADFAAWCTYKYLNGGPGAVAGYFVHPRHTAAGAFSRARYEGWWGNEPSSRFEPNQNFNAAEGAGAWQLSNVPVFSLLPLYASLPIFAEVGMSAVAAAGRAGQRALREALQEAVPAVTFLTPSDAHGAQLSISVPGRADEVQRALAAQGVLCDTRGDNLLRVAPHALYNNRDDRDRFVEAIAPLITRS